MIHFITKRPIELSLKNFSSFTNKFKLLLNSCEDFGLHICGAEGEGEPIVDIDLIIFNGDCSRDEEAWGDFTFRRVIPKNQELGEISAFKTNGRPYDTLVIATVLLIKEIWGDQVQIESTGSLEDWSKGIALFKYTFGHKPPKIFEGQHDELNISFNLKNKNADQTELQDQIKEYFAQFADNIDICKK